MSTTPSFLADGIATIASHNGVHRVTFYKLTSDQKPEPAVELLLPEKAVAELAAALGRLSGPPARGR